MERSRPRLRRKNEAETERGLKKESVEKEQVEK